MNDPVQRCFRARVAVLPVVHIDTPAQAAEETVTALSTGAHGVFLISHGGGAQEVERATDEALQAAQRSGFASPWLGVNLLGHHPWSALTWLHARGAHHVRAVWSDHSGLVPEREAQEGVRTLADARAAVAPWAPLFFGGVAFKYQPEPRDLAAECDRMLAAGVDALTTSGPGTGEACDPAKVAAVRARVGDRAAVAVASGVTPGNVGGLVAAGASAILVATGIARDGDFHRMYPRRLEALLAAARAAP